VHVQVDEARCEARNGVHGSGSEAVAAADAQMHQIRARDEYRLDVRILQAPKPAYSELRRP
jgi:hypothetical protein